MDIERFRIIDISVGHGHGEQIFKFILGAFSGRYSCATLKIFC